MPLSKIQKTLDTYQAEAGHVTQVRGGSGRILNPWPLRAGAAVLVCRP